MVVINLNSQFEPAQQCKSNLMVTRNSNFDIGFKARPAVIQNIASLTAGLIAFQIHTNRKLVILCTTTGNSGLFYLIKIKLDMLEFISELEGTRKCAFKFNDFIDHNFKLQSLNFAVYQWHY